MAEFGIKSGKLKLRSLQDPFTIAEIVIDNSQNIVASYEVYSKGFYILVKDEKTIEENGFEEDYLQLEASLMYLSKIFLISEGEGVISVIITKDKENDIKQMFNDMKEKYGEDADINDMITKMIENGEIILPDSDYENYEDEEYDDEDENLF